MRDPTFWKDHVVSPEHTFTMTQNSDGTYTLTPAWTVLQQGTNLSAANFQNMEDDITENRAFVAELTRLMILADNTISAVSGCIIEATLTNTYSYPFNNSQTTISIPTADTRANTDYYVIAEVVDYEGDAVGDIHISDKLTNGFKVAFDGSATSVSLKLYVVGGAA